MENTERYHRHDAAYGKISSHNGRGSYVKLDNGETGFSYNAGMLPLGTEGIFSVVREASGDRHCLVYLDSVCDYCEIA